MNGPNLFSIDILTLLPTYIENTKDAITVLSKETKEKFVDVEKLLVDDEDEQETENGDAEAETGSGSGKRSLAKCVGMLSNLAGLFWKNCVSSRR